MGKTSPNTRRQRKLREKEQDVFERLNEMLSGFMRTQTVAMALRLGLPEAVPNHPVDVHRIASRVNADEQSLYRFLRLLSSEGIFREAKQRKFASTPLSEALRPDSPGRARWLALLRGEEWYECWREALYSIQTGQPTFERVYHTKFFDYLNQHPDRAKVFNRAMAEKASERRELLTSYDWSNLKHVTDVGGGDGTGIAAVLETAPHLRGSLFDLPFALEGSGETLRKARVFDRCEIRPGDFFKDPIPTSDALILSQILHDWDDANAHAILANCRRSLPVGGPLLLVEGVIPKDSKPSFLKYMDIQMLILFGSKERTIEEWRDLLAQAEFRLVRVVPKGLIEARAI